MKTSAAAEPERTAWFDAATSPSRPGVYERHAPAGPYACWDGSRWRADAKSAATAARQLGASAVERVAWRGLVAAPSAPCSTCRGHTVIDRGFDVEVDADLIEECPDC